MSICFSVTLALIPWIIKMLMHILLRNKGTLHKIINKRRVEYSSPLINENVNETLSVFWNVSNKDVGKYFLS